jgi:hypothetical protein
MHETTAIDQQKTKRKQNANIARSWVIQLGIVDSKPMMFLRERSKIENIY